MNVYTKFLSEAKSTAVYPFLEILDLQRQILFRRNCQRLSERYSYGDSVYCKPNASSYHMYLLTSKLEQKIKRNKKGKPMKATQFSCFP